MKIKTEVVEEEGIEVILRSTASRSVCLGIEHSLGAHDQILVTVGHSQFCSCGAPSLTRRRVSNLLAKFTLGFSSVLIRCSKSHRTCDHILLSRLRVVSLFVSS
jgi:hypothetical protein